MYPCPVSLTVSGDLQALPTIFTLLKLPNIPQDFGVTTSAYFSIFLPDSTALLVFLYTFWHLVVHLSIYIFVMPELNITEFEYANQQTFPYSKHVKVTKSKLFNRPLVTKTAFLLHISTLICLDGEKLTSLDKCLISNIMYTLFCESV